MNQARTTVTALRAPVSDRPVEYDVTEADIEATRQIYASLEATTPEGYEEVRLAIAHCRTTRTAVEKRRKELKADALEWGRKVDGVAKDLTALIQGIELPLQVKKQIVDDEKARLKREAEQAEFLALQAKVKAEREAEEARLKAEREAEDARLAVERARIAAERKVFEDEQAAARAAQREVDEKNRRAEQALAVERRRIEEQARQLAEEIEGAARELEAKQAATAEAERLRVAALEAEEAEAKRAADEATRLAALLPDAEKVLAYAATVRAVADASSVLGLGTRAARARVATARVRLNAIAAFLEAPPETWNAPEVNR
jgi:chromosome segregation ATPase